MQLTPNLLRTLLMAIRRTATVEIGCDECFEEMGRFAEMQLAGLDAAEALPMVDHHLAMCADCREEYQALSVALQALSTRAPWYARFWR